MLRRVVFLVHLWCGLILGLYAAAIGLTGAALVYREEITAAEFPELFAPVGPTQITPDTALETVKQSFPGWRVLTLTAPDESTGAWMAYLIGKGDATQVYVDANSGRLRGALQRKQTWLSGLERLHFNLLSGRSGRLVNGYCALALIALAVTGVALWRPSYLKQPGSARGVHANLGLALAAFVIVMGFTGGYFTWFQPYVNAVRYLMPPPALSALPRIEAKGVRRTWQELAAAAARAVPDAKLYRISLMSTDAEPVKITLRHGSPAEFQLVSHVSLNPYTLEVMRLERLEARAAADRWIGNFSAVHFGVWAGGFSRVLWLLLGLAMPVLFATGLLMWIRKLRQRGRAALWS